jgi:hypothetical protein
MKKTVLYMMTGAMLAGAALAQTAKEGIIKQREENQQQRIGEGVENGSLTPRETTHLERKESAVSTEVRHDRKQNGGNLTNKQKAQINHQQNQLSKEIYKDKHNGRTQSK